MSFPVFLSDSIISSVFLLVSRLIPHYLALLKPFEEDVFRWPLPNYYVFPHSLLSWEADLLGRVLAKWIWPVRIPHKISERRRLRSDSSWLSSSAPRHIDWPVSLGKIYVSFFESFLLGWSDILKKAQLISS